MILSPITDPKSLIVDQSGDEVSGRSGYSDRWILVSVIALAIFGILAVFSSVAYFAEMKNSTAQSMVISHILKVLIAFFIIVVASKFNYRIIMKLSFPLLFLSWILLIIVTLYGVEVWGAKRSLNVGGFSFQPSSLAIVALLVHLVGLIERKMMNQTIKSFKKSFIPMMFYVIVTCGLIGIEDFSSAGVLMILSMLLMFMGGVSKLHLGTMVLIGILGGTALVTSSDARVSRITNYLEQVISINSHELDGGSGYQSQQAHIAIARGQFSGVGMGKSAQRDFLPAPYNDFIFAIIAEEYGILGTGLILILFTLILIRGIVFVARNAGTLSGQLLATILTLTFVLFGYVNAAVATGLFPVTGLPMPFVSYGGTSMIFSGLMIGIILNISKKSTTSKKYLF
jgi:cell division protein FtsW